MNSDNSHMFQVEDSQEVEVRPMPLFNKNTEIIKEGQRHKVVFGQMELEKKPLHEIVAPYLYKFASTTAQYASQAGSTTYQYVKEGLIWVYNKFINNVVPYAVENLPKVLFVVQKGFQNQQNHNTGNFSVINVEDQEFNSIYSASYKDKGKTRVVVPLGTENDKQFEQYLKKEKYEIKYDFPIDEESEEIPVARQAFMMPSQSFQTVCEEVVQSHAQLQMPTTYKRQAYKLQNCFIFQLEGQNTIQYDMLDSIEKCKDSQTGYLVFPQQTLRRSAQQKSQELDEIGRFVQGKQQKKQIQYEEKEVDMERKVHVELQGRKSGSQEANLLLN